MPQPRHTESSILQSYLLLPSPLPTILPYSSFLQLVPAQHRSHPDLKRLYRDLQFQRNIDVDTVRENIEREVKRSVALKASLWRRVAEEQGDAPLDQHTTNDPISKKRKRAESYRHADNENDVQNSDKALGSDSADGHENDQNEINLDEITNPVDTAIDITYYDASLHPSHTEPDTSFTQPKSTHPLTTGATSIANSRYHTPASLLASMTSAISDLGEEIAELDLESERLLSEMNEIVSSLSDLRYGRFAQPVSGGGEDGDIGRTSTTVEQEIIEALEGLGSQARAVLTSSINKEQ